MYISTLKRGPHKSHKEDVKPLSIYKRNKRQRGKWVPDKKIHWCKMPPRRLAVYSVVKHEGELHQVLMDDGVYVQIMAAANGARALVKRSDCLYMLIKDNPEALKLKAEGKVAS